MAETGFHKDLKKYDVFEYAAGDDGRKFAYQTANLVGTTLKTRLAPTELDLAPVVDGVVDAGLEVLARNDRWSNRPDSDPLTELDLVNREYASQYRKALDKTSAKQFVEYAGYEMPENPKLPDGWDSITYGKARKKLIAHENRELLPEGTRDKYKLKPEDLQKYQTIISVFQLLQRRRQRGEDGLRQQAVGKFTGSKIVDRFKTD